MDNEKMARFIAEQRKSKKLTQKQLAEKLGITDKAVSKWERGLSCPDIALLSELANILEVNTSELLSGEKVEISKPDDVDGIVETALKYADTVTKSKAKNIRSKFAVIISSLSVLGIIVCLICNFAITGKLTWSWFPISSLIYSWLIFMPLILWSSRGLFTSLIFTSLLTIPFLFVLEKIIGIERLILPLGIPVSIIVIVYLWVAYILIYKTRWPKYSTVAATFLGGLPTTFCINYIVSKQINEPVTDIWDILAYLLLVVISAIIFGCGYTRRKYKR